MLDPASVQHAYTVEGLTQRKIALRYGVSASQVVRFMRKHGLRTRTVSERVVGDRNPMFGKRHTSEARDRISQKHLKRLEDPAKLGQVLLALSHTRTPETRKQISDAAKKRVGALNHFFGKEHTAETKAAISKANMGRLRGANGSNWQGGKTKFGVLLRTCELYVAWRIQIFERDKYTCVNCGCVGGALNADHIVPLSRILTINSVDTLSKAYVCADLWELSNGRTLCVPCHRDTDTFAGRATSKKYRASEY
jgi:hypothetical protein